MEPNEEIALVLLLMISVGSVAITLILSLLHPRYRELGPRLALSTKMLGIPLATYGLLRWLTSLPLARFDTFLVILLLIYALEFLFFFTVMRHPPVDLVPDPNLNPYWTSSLLTPWTHFKEIAFLNLP